jgi:hypothetical protein
VAGSGGSRRSCSGSRSARSSATCGARRSWPGSRSPAAAGSWFGFFCIDGISSFPVRLREMLFKFQPVGIGRQEF